MWNVLPKLSLFKLLLAAFSILILSGALLLLKYNGHVVNELSWAEFKYVFQVATPLSILYLLIIYTIAKWGWKIFWWPKFSRGFFNKMVCPNLNGKWIGHIESNFINPEGDQTTKQISMTIKADFFGFEIITLSLDNYQTSKVVHSCINKDFRTGTFYISYIYEGFVLIPKITDDRFFEGAAKLEIHFNEDNTLSLAGTYWTNRAWQRNLNTAGIIRLERSS